MCRHQGSGCCFSCTAKFHRNRFPCPKSQGRSFTLVSFTIPCCTIYARWSLTVSLTTQQLELCSEGNQRRQWHPIPVLLPGKTPWIEEPGRLQSVGVSRSQTRLNDFTFIFHFHALEREIATHSSILAWRIAGMGQPGGLPSMGSHRVWHDWSDLAAAEGNSWSQSTRTGRKSPGCWTPGHLHTWNSR